MKKFFLPIAIIALSFSMIYLCALWGGQLFRYAILNIETINVIFIPFLFIGGLILGFMSLVCLVFALICLLEFKILAGWPNNDNVSKNIFSGEKDFGNESFKRSIFPLN
jgi:hypothetical protein